MMDAFAKGSVTRRSLLKVFGAGAVALAAGGSLGVGRVGAADQPVLLASGVSITPASRVAWRVLTDEIGSEGTDLLERAVGFVVPIGGAGLLQTDIGDGMVEIYAGEAHFVPEGQLEQYRSLTEATTRYLRIGLVVPEDADYPADGDLLLAGPTLEVGDEIELELHRMLLNPGDSATVPGGDYPWPLVHVSGGTVEFSLGSAGDGPVAHHVNGGEAAALTRDGIAEPGWTMRAANLGKPSSVLVASVSLVT